MLRLHFLDTFASARIASSGARHGFSNMTWPVCLAGALMLGGLGQAHASLPLISVDFTEPYTVIVGGEASPDAINIRSASDTINTSVNAGFDSFFGTAPNNFLVIGDNAGDLGGDPDGQPFGALSVAKFDLGLFGAGSWSLDVGFDFVFDTDLAPPARSEDYFFVALLDGSDNLVLELMNFVDVQRNEASHRGSFSQMVDFSLASPGNVYLAFGLNEVIDSSSSAVGIDNLQVSAVPEANTYLMLLAGLGFIGLRCAGRNRV
jgi:hypothetical protein